MLSRLVGFDHQAVVVATHHPPDPHPPGLAVDLDLGDHGDHGAGAVGVRDAPPGEDAPAAHRDGRASHP